MIEPGVISKCTGHFCSLRDKCVLHVQPTATITRFFTPHRKGFECEWYKPKREEA